MSSWGRAAAGGGGGWGGVRVGPSRGVKGQGLSFMGEGVGSRYV